MDEATVVVGGGSCGGASSGNGGGSLGSGGGNGGGSGSGSGGGMAESEAAVGVWGGVIPISMRGKGRRQRQGRKQAQ